MEILARGVLIGTLGMLAAFVFITAQYEKQLWLLLGVCASLSTLAPDWALEGGIDAMLKRLADPQGPTGGKLRRASQRSRAFDALPAQPPRCSIQASKRR